MGCSWWWFLSRPQIRWSTPIDRCSPALVLLGKLCHLAIWIRVVGRILPVESIKLSDRSGSGFVVKYAGRWASAALFIGLRSGL
jgi:hypothetical protein